jgi:hypothetical protein
MNNTNKTFGPMLFWVGLFALAMGYLESAVVVYLRAVWYPEGFSFPLKALSAQIAITELFREAATIIMLISIGCIAVKKPIVRFAFFIYAFAIWDIFYYLFLYFLVGWPSTLLEWDLLFLIPVAWIGPVIAPVINSITMIALAFSIFYAETRRRKSNLSAFEWTLLIIGSVITIISYTIDYIVYLVNAAPASGLRLAGLNYIPVHFNWWLFATGELLFFAALLSYWQQKNGRI